MGAGSELVDVVDARDHRVRTTSLRECMNKGLLHRAVAVLVFRSGGRLILQQRSFHDRWHPGRWTLSCTGHVKAGETYAAAARRELREELGLKGRPARICKLFLPKIRSRGLIEWEVTSVFVCMSELPTVIDRSELEKVEAVSRSRLSKMTKGRVLTPDAKIILRECLKLIDDRATVHADRRQQCDTRPTLK
jgi:isopentenyldiphosphate isomerase